MSDKLMIDFETRSRVALKERGLYVYAEDQSTEVFCCAVKENDNDKTGIWIPEKFHRFIEDMPHGLYILTPGRFKILLQKATEIHAFNAQFERVIYKHVLEKRMGFPKLPHNVWRCTAAKAAYFALPRSLAGACEALQLPIKKDDEGTKVMLKMTNPIKKTGKFHEDRMDFLKLFRYCVQDVDAEYGLDKALPDIPQAEIDMYHLDQKINDRGIYVDRESIQNLIWKVGEKQRRLLLKVEQLTGGKVKSTRQIEATKQWLAEQGVNLDNLQRETVKQAIKNDMPFAVTEMLGTRQALAKSSVSKLSKMKDWACSDSRIRGTLQFYGADTGRWAGRGIQPQNYPRDSFNEAEIEDVLGMGFDEVDKKYGCTMAAASKSLRGMLCAAPGRKLLCADFASIEARVLAWLAGEVKKVEAFRKGADIYVLNACDIYRVTADKITKDMRLIGKVCELALGYQGWLGAFQSMAQVYGVNINVDKELERETKTKGRSLTEEEKKTVREEKEAEIIRAWRAANSRIVEYWGACQAAAIEAIKTGAVYSVGGVKFGTRGRFLHIRLPSGRLLSYCDPSTETIKTKYGVEKEVVTFMGWDANISQWCKQYTYGGKITENIVQAVARDILRDALLRLEDKGYNTVMHVHDEALAEESLAANIDLFVKVISETPEWAEGCPIAAEGWEGKRYRK